jgi:hypothetical protein
MERGEKMRRIHILLVVALVTLLCVPASAHAASLGLWQRDFKKIATDGQGDWRNIYAWSMASFKGDLYVGTARQAAIAPVMEFLTAGMGFDLDDFYRPGAAPFLSQFLEVRDGQVWLKQDENGSYDAAEALFAAWNAASRAEIWRRHGGVWTKVYTAPLVPSLVRGPNQPYFTPLTVGFRHMVPYTDCDGVEALYASAGTVSLAHPDYARLLFMSVDGAAWTEVDAPDQIGRETRTLGVHEGKFYIGAGTATASALGMGAPAPGAVWRSTKPSDYNSWKQVLYFPDLAPDNTGVQAMTSANGKLYIGTENANGFEVWRSKVKDPQRNKDWKQLVTDGAGDRYNAWAGTMKTFGRNVYVGSMSIPGFTGSTAMKAFDIIRVRPDDSWQLLVGDREPAIPVEEGATRTPLTGIPSGFGMPTNLYCWQMEVYDGMLYVGSMDMSSMLRAGVEAGMTLPDMGIPPTILEFILQLAGFDLWKTGNGLLWMPVSLTGFGDYTNYGTRTIRAHAGKLYVGTANPFKGFQVWEGYRR